MSVFPTTWQGWAFAAACILYLTFRESLHRWLKKRAR